MACGRGGILPPECEEGIPSRLGAYQARHCDLTRDIKPILPLEAFAQCAFH